MNQTGKIDERIHTGPDGRVQLLNPEKLSDPEWFVREALTEWEVLATSVGFPLVGRMSTVLH